MTSGAERVSGLQNKTPGQTPFRGVPRGLDGEFCSQLDQNNSNRTSPVPFSPLRMSTTSQKHRDFVGEPMGDKPVTALSGIGETLGRKLEDQGFDKAFVVLGQFLLLKKDAEMFSEWLKDASGANSRQAASCAQCLKEWCDAFL